MAKPKGRLVVKKMFAGVYEGRRILVTGHTGFKGSWLIKWLKLLGAEVAGFSSDLPSTPNHFTLLEMEKEIKHYQGDIRNLADIRQAVNDFQPEIVFHLAAQALVRKSVADPVETYATNVQGMVHLLEAVRTAKSVKICVLITSDKAYKNNEWSWGYRETDELGGHDPYSASKSCAELVAHSFFDTYLKHTPIKMVTTRAGNVIGGGDWAADRIIPDCVRAWAEGKSVEIRSPRATRPWQHVLEPLSGYLWLGSKLILSPEVFNGEAYNFGPDANVNESVEDLLKEMQKTWPEVRWHIPPGVTYGNEAQLLKLSCDKALHYLKWRAILQFPETIAFTTLWYRQWMKNSGRIKEVTENQIREYTNLAIQRGQPWSSN